MTKEIDKSKKVISTNESNSALDKNPIARFFRFRQLQTNFRTEIIAGITSFMTISYILVVNPSILSNAIFLEKSGDLFGELVIVTAISALIATLMGGNLC